jgi:valyl-tRNA synthetase
VYFFENEILAEEGLFENRLVSPYENTISNPQTISVRVENIETGCFALTTLDLKVLPIPLVNMYPEALTLCDDAGDGFGDFDLVPSIEDIIGGFSATLDLVFYSTEADALAETDPIDTSALYTNSAPYLDYVWAVITDTDSPLSCKAIVRVKLVVFLFPEVAEGPVAVVICKPEGESNFFDLNAEIDSYIIAGTTTVLEDVVITYYESEANANAAFEPLEPVDNYEVIPGTTYWVRVYNPTTGCYSVTSFIVTISEYPTITAPNPDDLVFCYDSSLTFDLATLTAGIIAGETDTTTTTYHNTEADANDGVSAITPEVISFTAPGTYSYWARVENTEGCFSIVAFEILINPLPDFSIEAPEVLCLAPGVGVITLETINNGDTSLTYTYQWTDPLGDTVGTEENLNVVEGMEIGTYTVTITAVYDAIPAGCSSQASVTITDSQVSLLTLEDLILVDFAGNNTMTIPVDLLGATYGIGTYEYQLDGGDFSPTTIHFENLEGGEHILVIHDTGGCGPDVIIYFTIADYMRYFTPNGDGYNDTWQLLGADAHPDANIYIFDRFGKLLAKIDPASDGWDGTFNGKQLPSTDYWYTIELKDGRTKKGHFSLVRR